MDEIEKDLEPIYEMFEDPSYSVQMEGLSEIQKLKSNVVPYLIKSLKDPSWSIRAYSAKSLGKIMDNRAIEPLISAINDPDSYVRISIIQSLMFFNDPKINPSIKESIQKEKDGPTKEYISKLLEYYIFMTIISKQEHKQEDLETLASYLGDENDLVAHISIGLLCKGGKSAIPHIIKALEGQNPNVRRRGIQTVHSLKDPAFVPALIKCLDDPSGDIRHNANNVLYNFQDREDVKKARQNYEEKQYRNRYK